MRNPARRVAVTEQAKGLLTAGARQSPEETHGQPLTMPLDEWERRTRKKYRERLLSC